MDAHDMKNGSRRQFLGGSVASVAAGLMVHSSAAADETPREIRLGIIGCGGRGSGAVNDSLSINQGVKVVAAADIYAEKCAALRKNLAGQGDKIAIDDAKMYGGLDGYKRVLDDPTVDIVLIATSPGFRPRYVREAIDAGKHVFAEKPGCVDPAGYRMCLEAHAAAVAQGLSVVAGTQYRRQANYVGAIEQIRQGMIGDVIGATARYCSPGIWYRPRKEGMSDAEYQLNNWMHFIWLSGDQIDEQAVHNLDVMNWVMDANPVSAFGTGGRFSRPADSEMWDSMGVDYEYPGNRIVSFFGRHVAGVPADVGNVIYGSKGQCHILGSDGGSRIFDRAGKQIWEMGGSIADAYKREHKDLVDAVRGGKPIVELKQLADSSMVAVMGRMAAYTGQKVTWKFATEESKLDLFPKDLTWESSLPTPEFAVPGKTKLI